MIMKKLFTILVMLVAINVSAQWVNHSIENGEDIYGITSKDNYMFAGEWMRGVFMSTNAGINWSISPDLYYKQIYAFLVKGDTIYGGGLVPQFYKTTNNGNNWLLIPTDLNAEFICFYESGNYILAGTADGVFRSSNKGVNWSNTNFIGWANCIAPSNDKLIAGGITGFYESTDNGLNWTKLGSIGGVAAVARTGNNILAANANGVWFSSNHGINWQLTSLITPRVYAFVVYNDKVIAGTDTGIYVSTNNGLNWVSNNYGMPNPTVVLSMHLNNYNNKLYIGVFGQSIWSRNISELLGVLNISTEIPSKYSLEQNYPNPFNPITNFKFSMLYSGDVKIVVYDIQGREVQTLVNERLNSGTYEVKFDAHHGGSSRELTSGVYFYRMVTKGFTETKRMIIIK